MPSTLVCAVVTNRPLVEKKVTVTPEMGAVVTALVTVPEIVPPRINAKLMFVAAFGAVTAIGVVDVIEQPPPGQLWPLYWRPC